MLMVHIIWEYVKTQCNLYHCSDSPSPKKNIEAQTGTSQTVDAHFKWTLASFSTLFSSNLGTIDHALFIWLTDFVAGEEKEGRMTLSMNNGRITIIGYIRGLMTLLKWILEIPKPIHADPHICNPWLGPQREKGNIKVSVLAKVLSLKLRSSSHC